MSQPAKPANSGGRPPILIENVYEKETNESFVERHFRQTSIHRCRATAEFDVDAIVEEFGGFLIRSSQEVEPKANGRGFQTVWTTLIFQPKPKLFWHFLIKSQNNFGAKDNGRHFSLTVTAAHPEEAASEGLMLQNRFTVSDSDPGFFMVRDVRSPRRIPIKPEYSLNDATLDLHYGTGFAEWSARFSEGLCRSGLSILRGKPGTGKTSFLRHLIHSLTDTHRFYYIPVDAFGLLQAQISDFLSKEHARFPESSLVLVLEDAEQLLLSRRDFRDGLASSLLNFTDGFVGDMIQAHLICTINGEVKDLDEAVLRPGRQRFFREFGLLSWNQSSELARIMGIELSETRAYSLAELYHFKDTQDTQRLQSPQQRPIGFNPA